MLMIVNNKFVTLFMQVMRITIHGGVNEIGGNKIIVEDKDSSILLDFGMSYKERSRFYTEPWIYPKDKDDLLEFGILPRIDGIYKFDDSKQAVDAFFLSHAHTDHYKYTSFLKRSIDMYCGKATKALLDAFNEIRQSRFEHDLKDIDWNLFASYDEIKIGSITVKPIHVDHSIPAAYAFIIYASDATIAYTSDLRLHGTMSKLTKDFIDEASKEGIDAIICEATNLGKGEVVDEQEVFNKVNSIIRASKGLIVAGFSIADIDRLRTFADASIANGRRLIITSKQAYLLNKIKDLDIRIPDKDSIAIYKKDKKKYNRWEEQAFNEYEVLDADDVKAKQDKYLLVLQFQDLRELISIKPMAGSCYIYSSSEPFNEESEIEFEKFTNWLDHFGLPMYHVHASGHIMPLDLRYMLEQIKPKSIIPIHTEHQDMFARWCSDIARFVIPQKAKPIEIS